MALRLIVFDLDGTLLGADNRLSTRSVEVLQEARAAGLTLVAASGRGYRAAELVLAPTDAVEHVICSNGALLYHRPTQSAVETVAMTPSLIRALYHEVNHGLEGVCWAWETEQGVVPDGAFRELGADLDELKASPADLCLVDDPDVGIDGCLARFGATIRVLLAHRHLVGARLLRSLQPSVPGQLSASSSSAVFVEVTAPGVDKAAGLQKFCANHGFQRDEVVALGDHLNDLSMLQWAGRGIAMAGGHQEVLDVVAEHTEDTHADDGAAKAIEAIIRTRN